MYSYTNRYDQFVLTVYLYDSLFSDGREVAVVYFRNGYMPQNYVSEQVSTYSCSQLLNKFTRCHIMYLDVLRV